MISSPHPFSSVRFSVTLLAVACCAATWCGSPAPIRGQAPEAAPSQDRPQTDQPSPGEEASEKGNESNEKIYSNKLRWRTASEVDNFGYDIYRSQAKDGKYIRLTQEPILGAGTTDAVSSYEYVDKTIDPYETYFYYIESISMNGVRERFSPIKKAAAKLPPRAKTPSETSEDQ